MRSRDAELDVFLFPAVVGGGLGDIVEVLLAGSWLRQSGGRISLYRARGLPLPKNVDGPWEWPTLHRQYRLRTRASRALTVSADWGLAAAPGHPGPLGRPGPWAHEAEAVERAYGTDRTLHVSLQEFARVLTSSQENTERYREGGKSSTEIRQLARSRRWGLDVRQYRRAYRRFRAFDQSNLLHLFGTFRPSRTFAREFPEAVQTGPLWPGRPERWMPTPHRSRARSLHWCWYASPSTSPKLFEGIQAGAAQARVKVVITFRSAGITPPPPSAWVEWRSAPPLDPAAWGKVFRTADLRIVTGSRTLLEALELGGPWLYFNGVMGSGPHARRHRPEKIDNLLDGWPVGPGHRALKRDLRDFARARRVAAVVADFARDPLRFWQMYRSKPEASLRGAWGDQGQLLQAIARRWSKGGETSEELVRALRGHAQV